VKEPIHVDSDYESLMLPLLRVAGDSRASTARNDRSLADDLKLSPGEREARLPSGVKDVMYSRVHWAKTYLMEAGLLESVARVDTESRSEAWMYCLAILAELIQAS